MPTETVEIGKYKFNIRDNISKTSEGLIYSRSFKIGGGYADCVNVSISYDEQNKPISAKIPTLVYDEECSLSAPLDRGEGTIRMIKTLLRYINKQIPEINEFVFEDKSTIECGTEEEKYQKSHRKRGTHARPLVLYYFSIVFNGLTWYEKHFNAYQQDAALHKAYRGRVNDLLRDKGTKPTFNEFLRIAQPPMKYLEELKSLYEKAETYGDFFHSIPKADRCRLIREWLPTFMEHYLKGVFKNTDWVIDVRKMDEKRQEGGTRKRGQASRTMYYLPKGRIRLSLAEDMSLSVEDTLTH
jgi:hypothetical protein